MIKGVVFDLDNTLLDFMKMKDTAVRGAVSSMIFNGLDRFSERDALYFRQVQPIQYHSAVPSKQVYIYSFSLKPEQHQPTGTCNFSRLDTAKLIFSGVAKSELLLFATNYNILRISGGMGGLAYTT